MGRTVVGMYAFRTASPLRLARFWGELMDLPLADASTDQLAMLDFDHEHAPVAWLFQKHDADERSPVTRLGFDLRDEDDTDWEDIADRAESLGATRGAKRELDGARWIEMRDPDGNPFRVFGPRPE